VQGNAFWNLWPQIESRGGAIQVTRQGVVAASLSCGLTTIAAVLSLMGFSPFQLLDAAIFAVIAWRIYRLSFSWSIFGLTWFLIEKADQVRTGTPKISIIGWLVAAAFVMCYVNSIRATYFLRRNKEFTPESAPNTTIASDKPQT